MGMLNPVISAAEAGGRQGRRVDLKVRIGLSAGRRQSRANPSLQVNSLMYRENTGNLRRLSRRGSDKAAIRPLFRVA